MGRVRLSILLIPVFIFCQLSAQQYVLTSYSLEQGIPQSSILAIYQDMKGNLWFGSQGGVSQYNGQKFHNFDSRHGLAGNHITAITQDHLGRIWLGHRYKGITLMVHKEFFVLPLTEERINCLEEDEWGNVWVGTHGKGIYILPSGFDPLPENFIKLRLSDENSDFQIYDFSIHGGVVLAGSDAGLIQVEYDPSLSEYNINTYNKDNTSIPFNRTFSFVESDDYIWGMGEKGLYRLSTDDVLVFPDQVEYFPYNKEVDVYFLHTITIDQQGLIWGNHSQGVFRFEEGNFDFDFSGTNYNNSETYCIFSDREDNIWIGTMNQGVLKYSDDRFRIHNKESGLLNNVVTSVIKDKNDNLWVATEDGVCIFDGIAYNYLSTKNGLPHNSVQVIFEDSHGNIWLGYYDGYPLLRYNPRTKTFNTYTDKDGLMHNSILTIGEDNNGDVWFATLGHGVSRYTYPGNGHGEKFKTFTQEDGLCSNSFWTIHKDREGRLWFGSDSEGLSMYDGEKFYSYNEKDGLTNLSPAAISHDSENNLWIGSIGGGIFKYDGLNFTNFSIDRGLSSDSPFSIICDQNDVVWVGTNIGIDRFDPALETFKTYTREDGFLGIENNQNAIFRGNDGIIWFGTMNGVVRFDPSQDVPNTVPPITLVENIQLFFNDFEYEKHTDSMDQVSGLPVNLTLKHNLNHLTFECIGVSHKAPEKIKYQYYLENFDTEWNPVTTATSITYTNVPPGTYVFQVKACNNDGVWNEEAVNFEVIIFSPYWQTWWFRTLAIVFAIAVIYLIFWLRLKTVRAHNLKLGRLVDEKTLELKHEAEERKAAQIRAEESDKLKTAFLANMSHEIRTPVNAIIGFSDLMKDPELSEEDRTVYLEYITGGGKSLMNLINDIIDISKIEAGEIRISNEPCNLEKTLAELFVTFHEEIKSKGKNEVELVLDKPKNFISSEILTDPNRLKQILSNLLNNAIKFTEQGSISFGYKFLDDKYLHFFVSDTGIGIPADKLDVVFQRFRQVEDAYTRNYDGTGLGLTISRKLCRLIGGDMWVDSKTGEGSVFNFSIPFEMTDKSEKIIYSVPDEEIVESLKGKSILVVEDEDSNYILIENMLQGFNVDIVRAIDGLKAVDVFKKNGRTIDLVLMDIKIPGLNGYEATREIKKIKSKVPIVAQTAYAMTSEKQKCIDAGCDDYISKPYNKEELLSVIQKNIAACHSYY